MTRTVLYLAIGAVVLSGCISVHESKKIDDSPRSSTQIQAVGNAQDKPCQLLRHVVLFKFKDGTSAADVRKIENAFASLPSKVDAIYDLEWGTDVSVEGKAMGFTHCFLVTFKSEEDRAAYLPHPEHKKFGSIIGPHLDKVCVVDYWVK